jgi:1-acyl-sn-glycerol-3-phosphate acyltransferase
MRAPTPRQARRCLDVAADLLILWTAARFVAPRLDDDGRLRLSSRLARRTLARLGLDVSWSGETGQTTEPMLVVANHVSWLDVYLLNAARPMRFVAKSETRSWPFVGTIADRFGSFFIVRGSCRDAARVKGRVADALWAGESVAVFPEATTTDGHGVKPFYGAMFQAALDAGVRVQPVAIRYPGPDGRPNPAAAFIDNMTFATSLLNVIREPFLRAELRFGTPLSVAGRTRRELASAAHTIIVDALTKPSAPLQTRSEPARKDPPWRALGLRTRRRPSFALAGGG